MKFNRITFLLLILLLGACTSKPTPEIAPTAGIFEPPPVYTATIPGVPSPVVMPTATINYPESLTTQELHQRLDPFASVENVSCALPCYNGLVLGQSDTHSVYNFYAQLGIGIPDMIPGDYPMVRDHGTGRLGAWLTKTSDALNAESMGLAAPQIGIFLQDDIAETLYLTWGYYPPYLTVNQVLTQMGEPGSLMLAVIFEGDQPTYVLQVTYPDRQTGFAFFGNTTGAANTPQVCLNSDQIESTTLGITKPGLVPMDNIRYIELMLPVTQILGMSYADFAAEMAGDACLDIPATAVSAWQALSSGDSSQP
jgi:hypothetical protein